MTQDQALHILKLGKSVYLTGSAGSGKTYLLNQYIDYLKQHHVAVAITASTGIAATHMNGMTIHAWSGLGIRSELTEQDITDLEERRYLWDRISQTKVLIIDEVSMLHHFRLDLIDTLCRNFKRSSKPFGGLQVILCGDFFQLPPVSRMGEEPSQFIYKSEAWANLKPVICYLHEQHRQTDKHFLQILNDIRANTISPATYGHLEKRKNNVPTFNVEPTRLYTHNADVDMINDRELERLDGAVHVYDMTDHGRPTLVEALKKSCLSPAKLRLKIGARVMFVKNNYEAGYVNGTLGKVVDFDLMGPIVETVSGKRITANPVSWVIEEEGKVKAEIAQVPLRLAWAITVHKSQGMSLDAVEVDLSKSFEKGMGYVALSRVRTLEGLNLLGINENALQVHEEVLRYDLELQEKSERAVDVLAKIKPSELKTAQAEYLAQIVPPKGEEDKAPKVSTYDQTKALVLEKLSIKELATKRDMTVGTVIAHLETLVEGGDLEPEDHLGHLKPDAARFKKMKAAFEKVFEQTGEFKLSPARDIVGKSFDFEELRIARLWMKKGNLL